MNDHCHNLDAYLADDLPAGDATAFTEHLPDCAACSEAIDEQRWIDGLLFSNKMLALEVLPHNMLAPVHAFIARRQLRNKSIACGLAAAAAIFIALGWAVFHQQATSPMDDAVAQSKGATDVRPRGSDHLQATFVAGSDSIAVPVASRHPDVTVVRVYPAFQPRFDNSTASVDSDAANKKLWQRLSNGG